MTPVDLNALQQTQLSMSGHGLLHTREVVLADIRDAYDLGASSYITKPADPAKLAEVMKVVTDYWSDTVLLPEDPLRG